MPFGLKNAPSQFQKVIEDIFKPYMNWLIVYIDDILVFSKTLEEHQKHLKIFLKAVYDKGIVLSAKKMKLFHDTVEFLGQTTEKGQIKV